MITVRTFRRELHRRRVREGFSAEKLGAEVGVTRATIEGIEQGRHEPKLGLALALAKCLGFSLDTGKAPLPLRAGKASRK